jgi:hypothetical protein
VGAGLGTRGTALVRTVRFGLSAENLGGVHAGGRARGEQGQVVVAVAGTSAGKSLSEPVQPARLVSPRGVRRPETQTGRGGERA